MEILEASPADLDDIYDLICELESEKLDKDAFSRIYHANLDSPTIHYLLAVENESVIGFASLHIQPLLHHAAKIGEIQELIVSSAFCGGGTGSALFRRLWETAFQEDCTLLEVCCNQTRAKSHSFYLRNGMTNSHFKFTSPLSAAVDPM